MLLPTELVNISLANATRDVKEQVQENRLVYLGLLNDSASVLREDFEKLVDRLSSVEF